MIITVKYETPPVLSMLAQISDCFISFKYIEMQVTHRELEGGIDAEISKTAKIKYTCYIYKIARMQ